MMPKQCITVLWTSAIQSQLRFGLQSYLPTYETTSRKGYRKLWKCAFVVKYVPAEHFGRLE